eukprot:366577-Chlamydomonas_euryale.AAC.9
MLVSSSTSADPSRTKVQIPHKQKQEWQAGLPSYDRFVNKLNIPANMLTVRLHLTLCRLDPC